PAFNAGSNALAASLPKDQRGSSRVFGGTVDIGAVEVRPVSNLNDSGAGSLRQSIADAVAGDCVDIDSCLTGTILLTTGELLLDKDLTIQGPGANFLTVKRDSSAAAFRIFEVASGKTAGIIRLTIRGGSAPQGGGGIVNQNGGGIVNQGTLTVSSCT